MSKNNRIWNTFLVLALVLCMMIPASAEAQEEPEPNNLPAVEYGWLTFKETCDEVWYSNEWGVDYLFVRQALDEGGCIIFFSLLRYGGTVTEYPIAVGKFLVFQLNHRIIEAKMFPTRGYLGKYAIFSPARNSLYYQINRIRSKQYLPTIFNTNDDMEPPAIEFNPEFPPGIVTSGASEIGIAEVDHIDTPIEFVTHEE